MENTPEGRVVSLLLWSGRTNEDEMREGRRERNERVTRLSRFSNTPEGREERLLE